MSKPVSHFDVPPLDLAQFDLSATPEVMDTLRAALSTYTAQLVQRIDAVVAERVEASLAERVEAELAKRVQAIYEQLILSRRRMFGRSSEAHVGQGRLFDQADALAQEWTQAQERVGLPSATRQGSRNFVSIKARGKRGPLPADLPRIDIVHDVPDPERTCACGTPMVQIGEEVSEQLDIIPMQVRVLRHIRKRYGCPGGEQAPVTAAAPGQVLPKSNASNDLLAMLLTVKYVDGLPLARFEHVLARSGVTVPRQTLARWVIGGARALQPLHNLLRDHLLAALVIHMDETPLQVLKEPGKAATSSSYMWVQTGGPPGRPVVLYDYDASRSGQVPLRLLEGWRGYLMTDGYEGYGAIARTPGVEHLACWAHARRGFVEAAKVQAKGKHGRADEAIELIARLYRIERDVKEASEAQRHAARQAYSLPALAKLRTWLDKTRPGVPPSLALGKALAYLDKYWHRLIRYTERGDLPIDNN